MIGASIQIEEHGRRALLYVWRVEGEALVGAARTEGREVLTEAGEWVPWPYNTRVDPTARLDERDTRQLRALLEADGGADMARGMVETLGGQLEEERARNGRLVDALVQVVTSGR